MRVSAHGILTSSSKIVICTSSNISLHGDGKRSKTAEILIQNHRFFSSPRKIIGGWELLPHQK